MLPHSRCCFDTLSCLRQLLNRPPRVRAIASIPCHRHIYTTIFRIGIGLCFVLQTRPDSCAFLCDFCPSVRNFAASFLQIRTRARHPCLWLILPPIRVYSGLKPPSYCPCRAHNKRQRAIIALCLLFFSRGAMPRVSTTHKNYPYTTFFK